MSTQEQLAEPKNPCVGKCDAKDQKTGICSGCFRTDKEKLDWHSASALQKLKILSSVALRKRVHKLLVE